VRHNVPHRTTGKLVVAKDGWRGSGVAGADRKRAKRMGVTGLRLIDAAEIRRQEPHVKGACCAGGAVDGDLFGRRSWVACVCAGGRRGRAANLGEARDVVRLSPQKDSVG